MFGLGLEQSHSGPNRINLRSRRSDETNNRAANEKGCEQEVRNAMIA
jgi:hypothetical protein